MELAERVSILSRPGGEAVDNAGDPGLTRSSWRPNLSCPGGGVEGNAGKLDLSPPIVD